MVQALLANIAVCALALLAWNALSERLAETRRVAQGLILGVAMALAAVGSMALAYEVSPGVFYDMRTPLMVLSSLFGGWPAALIVGAAIAVGRVLMGGVVGPALILLLVTAFTGLTSRAVFRKRLKARHVAIVAALSVADILVVTWALLPPETFATLHRLWCLMALSFVSTVLLGSMLLREGHRRELARTNALYRAMVDALPDCLNIKDAQGRFLAVNPATAALMGASSTEALIGQTDAGFYPPEIANVFRADEERVLASGVHQTIEQKGRAADGALRWLSTLKTPILDADGAPRRLVTHNRDITDAKALEAELGRTRVYLDQALEAMTDGLALFDAESRLILCNRRYCELYPQTSEKRVPGVHLEDLVRASLACGEIQLPEGTTTEAYVAMRLAGFRGPSETLVEMGDGRVLRGRSSVMADGAMLVMVSDVTEQRTFERNLRFQALHDPLTGLPNRARFNEAYGPLLAEARDRGTELVVMLLDLDHFKGVNDTHGHAAGDALLKAVAQRMQEVLRPGDLVARLGGDEFALLLPRPDALFNDAAQAAQLARRISAPLALGDGTTLHPSATLGYTLASRDAADAKGLLRNADRALYQAKARRRGSWKMWAPEPEPAARAG